MQLAEYTRVTSPDFRGDAHRPESWLDRRGEVLRELPGRRVFRAEIDGQRVVIKEFTPRRPRQWLRGYARVEAQNAEAVRARGVPVVEPLAWARLRDGRQLIVLREEEGARSLKELALAGGLFGAARHELARRVGKLLARMHNAGVRHLDPHAGNLLVRPDGSVLLADAWDLRPGDYLSAAERARSLAAFSLFFWKHGTAVDRLLFWGAYGRASEFLPEELEALRQRVLERLPDAFRRLTGKRARKKRRLGRPLDLGRLKGLLLVDLAPALLAEIATNAVQLRDGPHVLKRSPTAWTFLAGGAWVVKVFLPKKATRPLRDLLCGSRADRALDAAEACFHRGLQTPEVAAVLRDTVVPGRSVLVVRYEAGALPLETALARRTAREGRALAAKLGKMLRRMHDRGLRHRDLKQSNLLVRPGNGAILLLDLDGIRQLKGPLDWLRRAKDLGNLAGSLLDRSRVPTGLRLRALDAYLDGEMPLGFAPGEFPRLVARHARAFAERRANR